ncbi:MAG TPA: acyl-CoA dehydrogenase family protein [Acetobacteraceae bacterium]
MDVHTPEPATNEHIDSARRLIPLLQKAGPAIDAGRELPREVLDAMHAAGLFRLLVPRALGGAELMPATYIQCVEAIAMGNASAAWCMNQNSGCSMTAAYLAPDVARRIFGGTRDVLAWGQARGRARADKVAGGWRVTGTWLFASGSRHATWLGAHCPVFDADGTQRHTKQGRPVERTMLFPRATATIEDVWQVLGLRGTGSDTYSVEDLFVADDYSVERDTVEERREDGLLYRFTTTNIYASGFGSVGLGIARAMLDDFVRLASVKTQAQARTALRDNAMVQSLVGTSDAKLRAARSWLIAVLEAARVGAAARGHLTMAERLDIRQASTFAIALARDVVNAVWHETGANAIFDSGPFERRFRDMNTVSQQAQGRASHLETVGQAMLGMEPNPRWL